LALIQTRQKHPYLRAKKSNGEGDQIGALLFLASTCKPNQLVVTTGKQDEYASLVPVVLHIDK
jgi:hypothetical protein